MSKITDFTKGDIGPLLLKMALPLIATNFIQTAYSLIDMIWIGRLGSDAVASVGTASFYINLAFALSTLILTGTGIKISHKLGRKDIDGMNQYLSNAFILMFVLGLIYSIGMVVFKEEVISFFKLNNETVVEGAQSYLFVSMLGVVIMYLNMLYTTIFNNFGNSKLTFRMNVVGLVINILLDPLMIFGIGVFPEMGIEGAAFASVLARLIVLILFFIESKKTELIKKIKFTINAHKLIEVLRLGVPFTIQRVMFIVIGMIMARLIASYGATGIAVQKIGLQVESISYMTIGGLHGAVSVFIGQNYGDNNIYRIRRGYKLALLMSMAFGILTSIVFILFAKPIFSVFVNDQATILMGVQYLRIIGLSQMFMCIEIVTIASFNGVGKTYVPAMVSLLFTSSRIPIAFILSKQFEMGLDGVWWSVSLTSMVKGILLVSLFIIFIYSSKFKLEDEIENA